MPCPRTPLFVGALALLAAGCRGAPPRAAPPDASGMVRLHGGSFSSAAPAPPFEDVPNVPHVGAVLVDVTPVTVGQYSTCVRAGRCPPARPKVRDVGSVADADRWSALCNGDRPDRADHPVNCVDLLQARAYCAWAGKRLPTKDELEWAQRNASRGTRYPWGDAPPHDQPCWSGEGNGAGGLRAGTCPVGSHPSGDSEAGLKDLAGNVWEWTETYGYLMGEQLGRSGLLCWYTTGGGWAETDPEMIRAGARRLNVHERRWPDVGFRCVSGG
jgi:formylglycine-generating enzyme required for sulfatase activity